MGKLLSTMQPFRVATLPHWMTCQILRAVALNLQGLHHSDRVHLRPSENTDIYITVHNRSKISHEVAVKIIFRLWVTTVRGMVLKGRSTKKSENHCSTPQGLSTVVSPTTQPQSLACAL